MGENGEWLVNYAAPCEFLDKDTHLCTVYEKRFEVCDRCHPLTLRAALFGRHLPPECAYVQLFRN